MQAPDDFNPVPGTPDLLQPGARRILAPNPSPMTYRGTNTYLIGEKGLAVIDPGPVITGAPVLGFGPASAGRSTVMQHLVDQGLHGGGEGIDTAFLPDIELSDGEVITGDGWSLEVLHTPGHLGNHIALALEDVCFTADHVMGWASSLVSPPDGDLTDFMASFRKLRARPSEGFYPASY